MPQQFVGVFAGFGFASSAGLNAWLTLFLVALAGRFGFVTLPHPYDVMTTTPVLIGLFIIMLIEGTVDKIPVADHASHVIHTVLQPIAGAILFASQAQIITDMHPALAFFVGALAAGTIHGARATFRPVVTATTGGLGNPVVSLAEDAGAAALTIGTIIFPVLIGLAAIVMLVVAVWFWRRRTRARPGVTSASG